MSKLTQIAISVSLAAAAWSAQAATTITQFNFNSIVPDNNSVTGTLLPSTGSGSAVSAGGVSLSFASGVGSSDATGSDNSALQTTSYPAQSEGNETSGVQFFASTVGYDSVSVSFDLRKSATASEFVEVQYTTNGSTFLDAALIDGNLANVFATSTIDLSGFAGTANNPTFGFRVVTAFAPGTTSYAATTSGSTYGTAGTLRFDEVTIAGTAQVLAVPEADALWMSLAGCTLLGALARRKRNA